MDALCKFDALSLSRVMMEHMKKFMIVKDGRHGLAHGYLLNHVFQHFKVPLGKCVDRTFKQVISLTTLIYQCKCIEGRTCNKAKSQVLYLLEQQDLLKKDFEDLIEVLAKKDVEISRLKDLLQQAKCQGSSRSEDVQIEMADLKAKNDVLLASNKNLATEVKTLTK